MSLHNDITYEEDPPGFEVNNDDTQNINQPNQTYGTIPEEAGLLLANKPYKGEDLQNCMNQATTDGVDKTEAILQKLKEMDVTVYIVPSDDRKTLLEEITDVAVKVAEQNRRPNFQPVLLYKSNDGRLFNLTISKYAVGPSGRWEDLLDTFSGLQAMVAVVVLMRSVPCAFQLDIIRLGSFEPLYLSLVLGLVLTEEISLSWLTASMLVRSVPSIAAYSLTSSVFSDWLRKILLLVLTLSRGTSGDTQRFMTLFGIILSIVVLLSNLGSRSWHFLQWKPLGYYGPFASLVGYSASVVTGIVLPYMGHREIEAGGKRALESVLLTAFWVAVGFVLSDYDPVQRFLVLGSETCSQDGVNIGVGIWFTLTLLVSMIMVARLPPSTPINDISADTESFLDQDHASPVGYLVPQLPKFVVDPNQIRKGIPFLSLGMEVVFGCILAVGLGGFIVFLSFSELDENIHESFNNAGF